MSIIQSLTHHAILFVHPNRKEFATELWKELNTASPAHTFYDHTVLDIDTARTLTTWANTPYNEKKIALLSFHTITVPAQNALLKIVEEPTNDIGFVFVTTNKEALIPTLYSRLQHRDTSQTISTSNTPSQFLATPSSERMKLPFVVKLLDAKDEEDRKDREGVRTFILSLTQALSIYPQHAHNLEITLQMASYAGDPSSSGKAILEYLSLLLPEIKV
jgi:hypothetical protein